MAWMFGDWLKTHDVFYPSFYLIPQLIYFFVALPTIAIISDVELFKLYGGGWDSLVEFQAVTLGCLIGLLLGIRIGANVKTSRGIEPGARSGLGLYAAGCFLGGVGLTAWVLEIIPYGGLSVVYGVSYGGGWSDIGYFREASLLGIAAVPMILLARSGKPMRWIDWGAIVTSASPLIIHGLLGARRGPTFMALAVVVGGYMFIRRKRISVLLVLPGGLFVGALLLFLVTNRDAIYIGSDKPLDFSLSGYSLVWESNEYVLGDAMLRYADAEGSFRGLRIITRLVIRIFPSALWPNKFEAARSFMGIDADLTVNAGVPVDAIAGVVGWYPSPGSAPAFVGDLCLEVGWMAPLASFAIGLLHGSAWVRSRESLSRNLLYLLLMAFSVYLVAQGIETWIFHWLFFGMPAAALIYFVQGKLLKKRVGMGALAPSGPIVEGRSHSQNVRR